MLHVDSTGAIQIMDYASRLGYSVYAAPFVTDVTDGELAELEARDLKIRQTIGTSANEFLDGGCRSVVLIYARGTTQPGNIGEQPGPQLANALKSALGTSTVAAQGVTYGATLIGNLYSGGCPPSEAASMATLIGQVASKCPSSKIVVSGYSQGAAMVHRSVEQLSAAVKAKIVAAVTFGDTQKAQDGGVVPGFDTSKNKI
ncbi:hypothetical protein O1611_g5592 [Lasiodiplodia mahajangana]|uniref:Uncharacterized protein n=1 Tax=Lasiodiplodia mahajangana TaxID=1108764 RepID=A0ACC2JKK7_9PEZI|nr:hypothetical protein O1611_g5592 [Lasiodiplodia mahajangana]